MAAAYVSAAGTPGAGAYYGAAGAPALSPPQYRMASPPFPADATQIAAAAASAAQPLTQPFYGTASQPAYMPAQQFYSSFQPAAVAAAATAGPRAYSSSQPVYGAASRAYGAPSAYASTSAYPAGTGAPAYAAAPAGAAGYRSAGIYAAPGAYPGGTYGGAVNSYYSPPQPAGAVGATAPGAFVTGIPTTLQNAMAQTRDDGLAGADPPKKRRFVIKQYKAGCCGWCNPKGCYDRPKGRCGCCNCRGCCDRDRVTYRRRGSLSSSIEADKVAARARRRC